MKLKPRYLQIFAGALLIATVLLTWFGYRATSEWQRSTELVADRRSIEALYLLVTAVTRDMRGVQTQVLPQLDILGSHAEPYELGDEVANAFSRFPYPESFFTWKADLHGKKALYVFNRTDREPSWYRDDAGLAEFPTTIVKDPPALMPIAASLEEQATSRTRFIVFETEIAGEPYQIIARPMYLAPSQQGFQGVVGFTVNMNWVRQHYFTELTAELSRVIEGRNSVTLEIVDESGRTIASNRTRADAMKAGTPVRERRFPLLFFDPVLRAAVPEKTLPIRYWSAHAQALQDDSMLAAASGSRRAFILISVAAAATVVALVLTVRATRSAAALATMKSEFVSAVTHELKTPISSIRLASETLARGRFRSTETVGEYATILLNEVGRLSRSVDNLLTLSRIQDIDCFYTFECLDPGTLMEDALNDFQPRLKQLGFDVHVDIPAPLPAVFADRAAILQVMENLLDNAIRYSNGTRQLAITAAANHGSVSLQIADKGLGIPVDEAPHVFEKFFRGRNVASGGTGLGLAIVHRVMRDHHGEIKLRRNNGSGTIAEILLPIAKNGTRP
ncbi:MAG TPA: HAMP domain-containing sensor histidine kinase [Terriglobia bacterium]|nr:HAMP domain-containing sensor histidine kinase [Terriglobia bacterium]